MYRITAYFSSKIVLFIALDHTWKVHNFKPESEAKPPAITNQQGGFCHLAGGELPLSL
jgi:hypothetical protein